MVRLHRRRRGDEYGRWLCTFYRRADGKKDDVVLFFLKKDDGMELRIGTGCCATPDILFVYKMLYPYL
jgi:hypothetical protein